MVSGGELVGSRPSSSKHQDAPPLNPPAPLLSSTPTSFRMATESMLETEQKDSQEEDATQEIGSTADSTFGVKSLEESMVKTPHADEQEEDEDDGGRRPTLKPRESLPEMPRTPVNKIITSHFGGQSPPSMSHSMTSLDSQAPLSSLPSSPKSISNRSFRPSDEDSMDEGSQAIASSSEDDAQPADLQDSAPQLIMPSIKMPSRRPFTERGRNLGRLKILIAGDSGVGKTSLIKSIVQTCEDIVHVDPIPSIEEPPLKSKRKQDLVLNKSTQRITEVYASTRPYPTWWPDVEETKLLQRRKSMGDMVLERNLCFVDTPGYGHGLSKMEGIESVVQYVESQLRRSFSPAPEGDGDILGLLSGSGGSQVDVVFYLISKDISHEDLVFLSRLSALTNIIPLLSKSDTLPPSSLEPLRHSLATQLHLSQIPSFTPTPSSTNSPPYTICSAPSTDSDNMDASLLMSSSYIQPLISSDLSHLLQTIFTKETVSHLKHLSAKKLLQAHGRHPPPSAIPPTSPPSPLSPYIQAKLADHTHQEEKLAQIKLAKWASDLQHSLRAERAKYSLLAHEQRASWLEEKLGECRSSQSPLPPLSPLSPPLSHQNNNNNKPGIHPSPPLGVSVGVGAVKDGHGYYGPLDGGDPLGLLRWNEAVRRRGWVVLNVVGVSGLMGALAVWAVRTWGAGEEVWGWFGGR